MPRFEGFPPAALEFYAGLEADCTKAYFDAHRETYESAVREPIEELVAEAVGEWGPEAKVFRPNRDVRFAKDKRPYKTAQGAYLARPGAGAVYVQVSATGLDAGGGLWELSRDQLERLRRAIDAPQGAQLAELAAGLEADGFAFHGPDLKTAPRGWPRDHPRIALLRRTRIAVTRRAAPGPQVHDPERSREFVFSTWRAVEPLRTWLERHVGPAGP